MKIKDFSKSICMPEDKIYAFLVDNIPEIIERHTQSINDISVKFINETIDKYKAIKLLTITEINSITTNKPIDRGKGVYFLMRGDRIVYIGMSLRINIRVKAHSYTERDFNKIAFINEPDLITATVLEARYILHYKPEYNKIFKNNITITLLRMAITELKALLYMRINIIDREKRKSLELFQKNAQYSPKHKKYINPDVFHIKTLRS